MVSELVQQACALHAGSTLDSRSRPGPLHGIDREGVAWTVVLRGRFVRTRTCISKPVDAIGSQRKRRETRSVGYLRLSPRGSRTNWLQKVHFHSNASTRPLPWPQEAPEHFCECSVALSYSRKAQPANKPAKCHCEVLRYRGLFARESLIAAVSPSSLLHCGVLRTG